MYYFFVQFSRWKHTSRGVQAAVASNDFLDQLREGAGKCNKGTAVSDNSNKMRNKISIHLELCWPILCLLSSAKHLLVQFFAKCCS